MAANRKTEVDAAIADVDFSTNDYQIEFDTDAGKIILDLWPDVAPGHCRNIIGLTKIGYYDGIIFHRVISGFVIQAGCPEGRGTGGARGAGASAGAGAGYEPIDRRFYGGNRIAIRA